MKIMTLNAHSHAVGMPAHVFGKNLDALAACILWEQVDVIALQEVCQTRAKAPAERQALRGYVPVGCKEPVREDNYALGLARRLNREECRYAWTWDGIKIGYDVFDEGLALFSRHPVERAEAFYLSKSRDYSNWKTRKALAADLSVEGRTARFVCTHMGWWNDDKEPFAAQMDRLQGKLEETDGDVFLMGDFNSPESERDTGYDYVKGCGWLDVWRLAENTGSRITVPYKIDGWGDEADKGLCIDYIWTGRPIKASCARVVFSGEREPVISDHFGILAEICVN